MIVFDSASDPTAPLGLLLFLNATEKHERFLRLIFSHARQQLYKHGDKQQLTHRFVRLSFLFYFLTSSQCIEFLP